MEAGSKTQSPKRRKDTECMQWAGPENSTPTQREIVQYPERRDGRVAVRH